MRLYWQVSQLLRGKPRRDVFEGVERGYLWNELKPDKEGI